jgi:hypothetical protein
MKPVDEVLSAFLNRLPNEASPEDVEYSRYVIEIVKNGLESIEKEGGLGHAEVEEKFKKWLSP